MERFASTIARTKNHPFYINCQQTQAHTRERELTQKFTNLLYNELKTPLFTIETACCKMPTNIAGVWRNNLEKMLNFLELIKTGVKGYVKTITGQPLRTASLRVQGNDLQYNVTKNLAHFRIILPAGRLSLEVSCDKYQSKSVVVTLNQGTILDMGDVILDPINGHQPPQPEIVYGNVDVIAPVTKDSSFGSVSGFVLDTANHPVKNANVAALSLAGKVLKSVITDALGAFEITGLPVGDLKLAVNASGKISTTGSLVHVSALSTTKGNVFHLEADEHVWGVPRLLFILVMGCMLVAFVGCVVFCITTYQNKRKEFKNYSFSLLHQNKDRPLFEDDDDDEEETDVYRAPIKSELLSVEDFLQNLTILPYFFPEQIATQPYYDVEDVVYSEDDDDEDDDILVVNK